MGCYKASKTGEKQWLFGHEKIFCKHSNTDEIICTHCQLTALRIDYVLNGVKYVERCETNIKKKKLLFKIIMA